MSKKLKALSVSWVDAVAGAGWAYHNDVSEVHLIESLGYLVKETEHSITLAAAISGDQCNATIAIPKAWIKKKKLVKI